jgi:IS605 OrfB family transposase
VSKLTYNTKLIFNSAEDKVKIIQVLQEQRFAWNECSKVKFTHVTKNSIVELHNKFYSEFRKKNPEIPSQVIISAEQSVLSSYRSIKSNKQKVGKAPEKKKLSIRLDKRTYSYKNGIFSIISLEKRVKCSPYIYPKLQELISKYRFCDPLLFEKNGEVWICLTFNIPETLPQNKLALGIDLGCRVNAATSEGNLYIDKKFNGEKRKLRFNKRRLQSKSKTSKSAKRHLKKLKRKEANKNKNFSHNLANKLIKDTKADTLVLENLKSLKVKKNKHENKNRISQVPIYQLKQILTYKALLNEKTVIEVCPSYTSQIDSQTDKKDGVRKGRRYYSKSGKIYDSDINGAINIGLRSKLPVSQTKNLTYGQANVNSPIVGVGRSQAAIPLG